MKTDVKINADRTPLAALEQVSISMRALKLMLCGLFGMAPEGSAIRADIGAALVHTNDVLAWIEQRLSEFNEAGAENSTPKPDVVH